MGEVTFPIMNTFYTTLLFMGGVQGFVLAFILLKLSKSHYRANLYMALILMALGAHMLHQFLVSSGYIFRVKPIIGVNLPLEYLFGPCIYLYIKTLTQPEEFRRKELLHFIPALISILLLLPFYQLDFESKWRIVDHYLTTSSWPDAVSFVLPVYIVTAGVSFMLYLLAGYRLLRAHQSRVKHYFSYAEKVTLSWFSHFFWVFAIFLGFFLVFVLSLDSLEIVSHIAHVLYIFTLFAIYYLGIGALLQPAIYAQNPTSSQPATRLNSGSGPDCCSDSSIKYQKSALDQQRQRQINLRLQQLMEDEKPYLNADLTLPKLAQALSISRNHLSQTLNDYLGLNFFEFIAGYRVAHAKMLLIHAENAHLTILDVAIESGFNSRSAFYSAFKHHTGMTAAHFKQINRAALKKKG